MNKTFFAALVLVTVLPLAILPLYGLKHVSLPFPVIAAVLAIWVVTGYGHVMSTVWFGLDEDYRPVIAAHRIRMIASLAIIPIAMAVIAIADRWASAWLYTAFLVWQAHHYGRQNYGLLSLASAHDKMGPLPRDVGWIINITSIAGALGMVAMPSIYPLSLPRLSFMTPQLAGWGHGAAIVCFVAAGGLIARLCLTHAPLRRSPTVLVFLGLSGVFFLPSLLSGAAVVSFWPYAMAHGAQYLVMMSVTARRSPSGWRGFGVFAAGAVGLGALAVSLRGLGWIQAYTGVVIWHFLADARLWRLRDPQVRAIVRRRFDFVFKPTRPAPVTQAEPTQKAVV